MPSYDTLTELAKIRTATRANVALNAVQTGLLVNLGSTMDAIGTEIAATRQAQTEALAVQQALLQQEALQGQLEEFIYQSAKVVAECSDESCELPPSTRFFWLRGITEQVKNDGIATPIIRGRDNKQAFEEVMDSVNSLAKRLQNDPEVKEALEWAKAERERAKVARRKVEAEQKKGQQERQKKIQQLEVRYSTLQTQIAAPVDISSDEFVEWYKTTISPVIAKYSGPIPDIFVHVFLMMWGLVLYPAAYFIIKWLKRKEENKPLLSEMRTIEDELNRLLADDSIEGPVTGIEMSSPGVEQ